MQWACEHIPLWLISVEFLLYNIMDDAYKPELRLTLTRGFGSSSPSQSNRGGDISQILQSAEKDLNQYSSFVGALGTSLDSLQRRQEAQQLRASIKDKLQTAEQQILGGVTGGKSDVVSRRISNRFENLVQQFKKLTNLEKKKMENGQAETNLADGSYAGSEQHSTEPATQEQMVGQTNIEVLESQADDIRNLEKDILDLNEITTDLHTIVNEQGEAIDRIEHHTEKASTRVEKATGHTTTAVSLKRDNRTLLLVILILAGIIIGIVVVIVVIIAAVIAPRNS